MAAIHAADTRVATRNDGVADASTASRPRATDVGGADTAGHARKVVRMVQWLLLLLLTMIPPPTAIQPC